LKNKQHAYEISYKLVVDGLLPNRVFLSDELISYKLAFWSCQTRDVRGTIWFGFETKSHPNHKINKYAVWFGSVDF